MFNGFYTTITISKTGRLFKTTGARQVEIDEAEATRLKELGGIDKIVNVKTGHTLVARNRLDIKVDGVTPKVKGATKASVKPSFVYEDELGN